MRIPGHGHAIRNYYQQQDHSPKTNAHGNEIARKSQGINRTKGVSDAWGPRKGIDTIVVYLKSDTIVSGSESNITVNRTAGDNTMALGADSHLTAGFHVRQVSDNDTVVAGDNSDITINYAHQDRNLVLGEEARLTINTHIGEINDNDTIIAGDNAQLDLTYDGGSGNLIIGKGSHVVFNTHIGTINDNDTVIAGDGARLNLDYQGGDNTLIIGENAHVVFNTHIGTINDNDTVIAGQDSTLDLDIDRPDRTLVIGDNAHMVFNLHIGTINTNDRFVTREGGVINLSVNGEMQELVINPGARIVFKTVESGQDDTSRTSPGNGPIGAQTGPAQDSSASPPGTGKQGETEAAGDNRIEAGAMPPSAEHPLGISGERKSIHVDFSNRSNALTAFHNSRSGFSAIESILNDSLTRNSDDRESAPRNGANTAGLRYQNRQRQLNTFLNATRQLDIKI